MKKLKLIQLCLSLVFVCLTGCGVLINPTPEIVVKQDSVEIPSITGEFDFGDVRVGNFSLAITFTIENNRHSSLKLADAPDTILKINDDEAEFAINQTSIQTELSPEDTTSFTITFNPASEGLKSATVLIDNNDIDENPYSFTIKGAGVIPEINVKQGSTNIPTGSGIYDFGEVIIGDSSPEITFTIENTGSGELNLDGSPDIIVFNGADTSIFSINQTQTTNLVSPGTITSFTVIFSPLSVGIKSVTIVIANDDTDENPYIFLIMGLCTANPEINIQDAKLNDIESGSGSFDFGLVSVGTSIEEIFTIQNTGDGDLILSGTPLITITGSGASVFSVSSEPITPISPGSDTTFKIEFAPIDMQQYSAIVSITNNDLDENPYTFTITGMGFFSDTTFDFNGDGFDDIIVGAYKDDDGGSESGCAFIFFGSLIPSAVIDAEDADVKIIGGDIGDKFGFSVSSAGDFNRDGYDDAIIGAATDDDGGMDSGCAYIIFGSDEPLSEIDISDADIIIIGENHEDHFGCSVSSAGDFNGDGTTDIIVGARGNDSSGSNSGCAYIFYGSTNPSSNIDASDADVIIINNSGSGLFGYSVSLAGDFNKDGLEDIIVGAYGYAYIFFGSTTMSTTLETSNANVQLIGNNFDEKFGFSVSSAGDVNNDGFKDVIVGAPLEYYTSGKSSHAYIFFGSSNPVSSISASDADVILIGEDDEYTFGDSVSNAGDINNDGFCDVIVGSKTSDLNTTYSGCAFVFFGSINPQSEINTSDADLILFGDDYEDYFGISVSTAGDVNKDGFEDFIVGALFDDDGGLRSGCAFIFLGKENWNSSLTASDADVKLIGEDAGDSFGWSVAGGK